MGSRGSVLTIVCSMLLGCGSAPPAHERAAPPPPTTAACDAFFASPSVRRLVDDLGRLASVAVPFWATYRAERHPVLLVGPAHPAAPTCALLQAGGREIARVALDKPVTIPLGVYWFYIAAPLGPRALPEMAGIGRAMQASTPGVRALLDRHGVDRALLLRVDFDPAIMTALHVDPVWYAEVRGLMPLLWIVHETFHLQSQLPTWLDQRVAYGWPAWDRQPDRKALVATCYGGDEGERIAAERAALRSAFEAFYRDGDRRAGCAAARSFIALREDRYRQSAASRVASGAGDVGCDVAEAVMELEEGVPDYIANGTALELGLISAEKMPRFYAGSINARFYELGSYQLLVVRRLVGAARMQEVTARIAASADHRGGVFGELARAVGDPAICGAVH